MDISIEKWEQSFNKLTLIWTAKNSDLISNLTDIEIGEIGDELQLNAFLAIGGEESITDWDFYEDSSAYRTDFQYSLETIRSKKRKNEKKQLDLR